VICNDQELHATLERIARFQRQLEHLRRVEANSANYRSSASGFLAEIDRMNLEVREYLAEPLGDTTSEAGASAPAPV
jgi:hypothetical protein